MRTLTTLQAGGSKFLMFKDPEAGIDQTLRMEGAETKAQCLSRFMAESFERSRREKKFRAKLAAAQKFQTA